MTGMNLGQPDGSNRSSQAPTPQERVAGELLHQLLGLNEMVRPFHEWLAGQRAYFLAQGYTEDEARAMAASIFVSVFGANIRTVPGDNLEEGGQQ